MLILVIGGSGSGKSEFAEKLCCQLGAGKKYYIATMKICDEESRRKVDNHRARRAGRGFETLECPVGLEKVRLQSGSAVLLECMSNLTANEMFDPEGRFSPNTGKAVQKGADRDESVPANAIPEESVSGEAEPGEWLAGELLLRGVFSLQRQAQHLVVVTNQVFSDGIAYDPATTRYIKLLAAVNEGIAAAADVVYEVVCGIPIQIK